MLAHETMHYSKPEDSLPDPKASLSSRQPSQAIVVLAIKKVEKVTNSEKGTKRGRYTWITDQQGSKRVEVARLRSQ